MTRKSFRVLLIFVAAVMLSIPVLADTIRLKDGSLIKGTIVSFADGRFVIVVGEGSRRRELTLAADEIASIQFDKPSSLGQSSAVLNDRPSGETQIVPVSTRPAPKLVITDNSVGTRPEKTSPPVQRVPDNTIRTTQDSTQSTVKAPVISNLPPARSTNAQSSAAKPISLDIKVLADNTANGWTNSGWIVKKGQRIRITGSGTVLLGRGKTSTPSGLSDLDDDQKLLKSVPTGALIAVIGDDNNDFLYIGDQREFTAGRDGALYLGVNEGNLNDNSGSYQVKVEIILEQQN